MTARAKQPQAAAGPRQGLSRSAELAGNQTLRWFQRPVFAWIVIFIVAATIRIAHYSQVRRSPLHDNTIHLLDARYYDTLARRIAAGAGLSNDVYFMAPLYPYALSMTYRFLPGPRAGTPEQPIVYGPEIHAAAYVQCLWGALTCVLTYELARRLAGQAAGWIAGLTAALYGMFIFQDSLLMATQLITFVNVAAMLILLRAGRGGGIGWWLVSGLMLGLCAIAHGTALLLIPGVVLWIVVAVPAATWKPRLVRSVLVCAGAVLCIGAVTVRNYVVGHDWVLLTSNSGLTFFIGNNAAATGTFAAVPGDVANTPGASLFWYLQGKERGPSDPLPSVNARHLRDRALDFIRANPAQWLGLLWHKFELFWNAVEVGSGDQFYFYQRFSAILRWPLVTFGILAPIGLTGLICSLPRWRHFFLIYIWLAIQAIAYTLTFVLARYRLVAVACLIVLASAQMVWWLRELQARRLRNVGLSLLALVAVAFFIHHSIPGFTPQRGWGEQYRVLGTQYLNARQFPQALECFEQALHYDFAPRDENSSRLMCLASLTQLYSHQGRTADVANVARQALTLLDQLPVTAETRAQHRWFEDAARPAADRTGTQPSP